MTCTCICGAVSVTIETKPEFIYDCNCSLCRKSGGAWGYFTSSAVMVKGVTAPFVRKDKLVPMVEVHSCEQCGATTHFVLTQSYQIKSPSADQVGVNMRLFAPDVLEGINVHYPNGNEWSGEGAFDFRRKKMKISEDLPW